MKSIKKFSTVLMLGLALALSTAAFSQNTGQSNNDKKGSCCAMASCCGKGDSCSLKEGTCCKGDKSADKKDGCCCHSDSCDMKGMKDAKNKKQVR
jgi:hypothetical protein